MDHTISGQGTAVSTLDHSATTPNAKRLSKASILTMENLYFSATECSDSCIHVYQELTEGEEDVRDYLGIWQLHEQFQERSCLWLQTAES